MNIKYFSAIYHCLTRPRQVQVLAPGLGAGRPGAQGQHPRGRGLRGVAGPRASAGAGGLQLHHGGLGAGPEDAAAALPGGGAGGHDEPLPGPGRGLLPGHRHQYPAR